MLPGRASGCAILLGEMKLQSWAKTSGSKGLQLYVPLNTPATFDQTKALSRALAEHLEREHPDLVVHQNAEVAPRRQGAGRLEPERRAQDDGQRLFAAREGAADRLDAGDVGGSRGVPEKEEPEAA